MVQFFYYKILMFIENYLEMIVHIYILRVQILSRRNLGLLSSIGYVVDKKNIPFIQHNLINQHKLSTCLTNLKESKT